MGSCPICKTSANEEHPNGGDYRRVECRKCGKYQITGTALSMLKSRMAEKDKKAIARLSHATRLMASATDAEWPEINSVNLDDMLKSPLPTVDRQITNFLTWAAMQLGDDHLGIVELPDEDDLTGIVGTIDGARVDDLISRAESMGLVEFVPDNCIKIKSEGWARLEAPPAQKEGRTSVMPKTGDLGNATRRIKAHCNRCGGLTNSWVRAEHTVVGSDGPISWSDTFEILECCGCDTLSVRHKYWFSEWDDFDHDEYGQIIMRPGIKETYYPAPTVRTKPVWSDSISDGILRAVLEELYVALNAGLSVLASIGARTLLDRAGYLLLTSDPPGGFAGKLSELQKRGYISAQEKTTLEAVADAGNASAHRGYLPTAERLGHIVDIIENFLHRAFVLTSAAEEIRKSTPTRQKSP